MVRQWLQDSIFHFLIASLPTSFKRTINDRWKNLPALWRGEIVAAHLAGLQPLWQDIQLKLKLLKRYSQKVPKFFIPTPKIKNPNTWKVKWKWFLLTSKKSLRLIWQVCCYYGRKLRTNIPTRGRKTAERYSSFHSLKPKKIEIQNACSITESHWSDKNHWLEIRNIWWKCIFLRKSELTSHSWSFLQGLCFSASKYFGSPHQPFVQRKEPDFQPVHFVFGCFFYQTYWWFPHTYRVVYLIGSPLFQYWKGKRVEASHSYHSTKSSIKEQSAVLLIAAHHVWST